MKQLLASLVVFLLAACAAGNGSPSRAVDPAALAAEIVRLPGAVLVPEPLQFSYPDEAMFGRGAVLPLPGGTRRLDPLAEFLLRHPGTKWQVDVRVQTAHGRDYDQLLAEKRSELLATYLLNKGVDLRRMYFQPEAAAGEPLGFCLKPSTPTEKP